MTKLPSFKSEDEERGFWATHELSGVFDVKKGENVSFPNLKPSTKTITLRVSESLLNSLKRLANKRDVPYQSLTKFLLEDQVRRHSATP